MKLPLRENQYGFTLIELLIILVIVFLVAAIAISQIGFSRESLEMQNVSTEFKVYLERARFDSVKRSASDVNEMAKVTIHNSKAFSSQTDFNLNGKLEAGEIRNIDFSYQEEIKFYNNDLIFPVVISFNNRGHATAVDGNGATISSTFLVCQKNCEDLATKSENFQIVSVSPTGTVTILNGDELLEKAVAPQNVSTDTSSGIKPLVSTIPSDGSILW